MKRKTTLLIAVVVSIVAVSLISFESRVTAENQIRVVGDTGVITLGPNQELRVTAAPPGDVDGADFLVFRRIGYMQDACSGGVCKLVAASQTNSGPIELMPNEAAMTRVGPEIHNNVRVVVLSNRRRMRATATIIDMTTGNVVSQIIVANTDGEWH